MRIRRIWDDYGLSITLILMFLAAWALQTWTGWVEFQSNRPNTDSSRRRSATTATSGTGRNRFENWQSEFLQVLVFVVLTTFLVHRKSHESPDTDYDAEAALRRIEAKVDALEKRLEKG